MGRSAVRFALWRCWCRSGGLSAGGSRAACNWATISRTAAVTLAPSGGIDHSGACGGLCVGSEGLRESPHELAQRGFRLVRDGGGGADEQEQRLRLSRRPARSGRCGRRRPVTHPPPRPGCGYTGIPAVDSASRSRRAVGNPTPPAGWPVRWRSRRPRLCMSRRVATRRSARMSQFSTSKCSVGEHFDVED